MSRHTLLIGKRIEVVYRCGTVDLFASGLLLDDTGNHIVIEQHSDQHGSVRAFQLQIPHGWIVRLNQADSERVAAVN